MKRSLVQKSEGLAGLIDLFTHVLLKCCRNVQKCITVTRKQEINAYFLKCFLKLSNWPDLDGF